jgi:hypothetical protein
MLSFTALSSSLWDCEDKYLKNKNKKKPKTLQSWAKSTKGGGWRRQLWQVQEAFGQKASVEELTMCLDTTGKY